MPGASEDSTRAPATAPPTNRAVISTSGSSGIALQSRVVHAPRRPGSRKRRDLGELFKAFESVFTNPQNTGVMSDLLAVLGSADEDEKLLAEIARRHPDRVTVLAEGGDDARVASIVEAIEQRTGAHLVGLVD